MQHFPSLAEGRWVWRPGQTIGPCRSACVGTSAERAAVAKLDACGTHGHGHIDAARLRLAAFARAFVMRMGKAVACPPAWQRLQSGVCRPADPGLLQQNFQRLPQLTHVTKVVMGSSALRVCIW